MHTAVRLAADPGNAAVARRSVEWFAQEIGVDASAAAIVATELVTNAIRHGAEPIVLHLRLDSGMLVVEVSDGGDRAPRAREDRVGDEEGGWGLFLVEQLSRTWGVRESPRGWKTVWAEIDTVPDASAPEHDATAVDGVVSSRAHRERQLADVERFLARGERKLGAQCTDDVMLTPRVAALRSATTTMRGRVVELHERVVELHAAAAALHDRAAALHERVAAASDEHTQRLYDRYR
jgi:anti-sigma regulatory factor (Ser/Thr protein kinase)